MTAFNPILPLDEYIPDGEPHTFGDRVYLFGSHDVERGERYCAAGNYVAWSAPLSDPTEWTCSGVIYEAGQDPQYSEENRDLYAPDVVQGNDGRYYMYYCFGGSGFYSTSVAVADKPDGRYEYLGCIRNPDGTPYHEYLLSDPAVINDDGVIRLYGGWSLSMVAAAAHARGRGFEGEKTAENEEMKRRYAQNSRQSNAEVGSTQRGSSGEAGMQMPDPRNPKLLNQAMAPVYQMMFHKTPEEVAALERPLMGANTVELADDMLTIAGPVHRIVEGQFSTPEDSSFYGHAFYEASSIRKINGKYYFIYSSQNSNELCYATSDYPDHDFVYGGTIISNGDVGYQGTKDEDRTNMTANDHGSLCEVNGQWYIFHHRQTHGGTFSRQACVEPVVIAEDGSIAQVECTSMGFGEHPIEVSRACGTGNGTFPAAICCRLTNGHMPHVTNTIYDGRIPMLTSDGTDRFVGQADAGTEIGYKYFRFDGETKLTLTARGEGQIEVILRDADRDVQESERSQHTAGTVTIASEQWTEVSLAFVAYEDAELVFAVTQGSVDVKEFAFS